MPISSMSILRRRTIIPLPPSRNSSQISILQYISVAEGSYFSQTDRETEERVWRVSGQLCFNASELAATPCFSMTTIPKVPVNIMIQSSPSYCALVWILNSTRTLAGGGCQPYAIVSTDSRPCSPLPPSSSF
ncbi:hypothetical protein PS2_024261 [Malus domestica]